MDAVPVVREADAVPALDRAVPAGPVADVAASVLVDPAASAVGVSVLPLPSKSLIYNRKQKGGGSRLPPFFRLFGGLFRLFVGILFVRLIFPTRRFCLRR